MPTCASKSSLAAKCSRTYSLALPCCSTMAGTAAMSPVAHMSQVPARLLLLPVMHAMQGLQVGGSMLPLRPQKRPAGWEANLSIQAVWCQLLHACNV